MGVTVHGGRSAGVAVRGVCSVWQLELCVSAACIGFGFIPFSCKKRQKNEFFIMAQKLVVFLRFIFL